ncbi:hypothetical protein TGME49_215270 [Toxoplasma gondii ME49]|uniref:Uncharacterized protein n=3 Tax=Toxoplasma gondii TaxID=5811 RepID=A0A086LZV0_TOXGO|nr:hypothetical protein TGME49_215270 [Toxoplasma gondii ME49]EPT26469.1 hypothetical protein TGME49_215270 [Toxoplasma gondii ME49]KFG36083.1 hypothetical protein TGDOM2_215270 [Toxoplasma gondii GAB2-2007-GAL-DOM2]KFG62168.1 hypothetical protein TGRUB_215270 [Toxoplasma gondii RUB]|eukprot:XP_002370846.1 hypothetical protein TGME49_215270 [Toxoplasma gondii ME49]
MQTGRQEEGRGEFERQDGQKVQPEEDPVQKDSTGADSRRRSRAGVETGGRTGAADMGESSWGVVRRMRGGKRNCKRHSKWGTTKVSGPKRCREEMRSENRRGGGPANHGLLKDGDTDATIDECGGCREAETKKEKKVGVFSDRSTDKPISAERRFPQRSSPQTA